MTRPNAVKLSDLRGQEPFRIQKVRWYRGYAGIGKVDVLVEGLSRYLRQHRLTDTVCGMRVERKPRGQFYFFLTFETDDYGSLPEMVQEVLDECPLLNRGAGGPYQLPDIQSMVSGELKIKALGQCIAYRILKQEATDDPFSADVGVSTSTDLGDAAQRLLCYLSALGGGRWATFQAACAALQVGDSARRLARTLRLLGHLEVSPDGETWSVTPPAAVRVEQVDGSALFFQAGARRFTHEGILWTQGDAPPRLGFVTEPDAYVTEPGLSLAQLLPDLRGYQESLTVVGGVSPVKHEFARFDGQQFVNGTFAGEVGLYEVKGQNGRSQTLLYDVQGRWLRGDWYGLRYLTLHHAELLVAAQYDAQRWWLALPADQRPPEWFERALVLCSGLLPVWEDAWLVYQNVRPEVAELVLQKLDCPLEIHDLPRFDSAIAVSSTEGEAAYE